MSEPTTYGVPVCDEYPACTHCDERVRRARERAAEPAEQPSAPACAATIERDGYGYRCDYTAGHDGDHETYAHDGSALAWDTTPEPAPDVPTLTPEKIEEALARGAENAKALQEQLKDTLPNARTMSLVLRGGPATPPSAPPADELRALRANHEHNLSVACAARRQAERERDEARAELDEARVSYRVLDDESAVDRAELARVRERETRLRARGEVLCCVIDDHDGGLSSALTFGDWVARLRHERDAFRAALRATTPKPGDDR